MRLVTTVISVSILTDKYFRYKLKTVQFPIDIDSSRILRRQIKVVRVDHFSLHVGI